MKYPSMGSNSRNAVSIPALSGGVNYSDALNLVDDNQMTDCKNVWYKDGVLQTRPGVEQTFIAAADNGIYAINGMYDCVGERCKLFVTINEDGTTYELYGVPENFKGTDEYGTYLYKWTLGKSLKNWVFYNGTAKKGMGLYALLTFKTDEVSLYELSADGNLQKFDSDELYIPTVYINGKGDGYEDVVSEETAYAPASFFEGYNAFTDAWAAFYFTTDERSLFYKFPDELDNCLIQLEVSDLSNNVYKSGIYKIENKEFLGHGTTSVINGNGTLVAKNGDKQSFLYFSIYPKTNSILALNADKVAGGWPNAIGAMTNNFKIMIKPITPPKSILAGASIAGEFGGVSKGIYGGTRTFLTGFSDENKNLLIWSDLNNPTYFSENNYNYIGLNSEKITALAKQDDMLVIFKESEMYYATYIQGENYTSEDVLTGRVVDVTTLDATFPVVQISDKVGCDIPESIQLCGDRLVWADTNNNVYMLRSANQYSTVNISIVSNMVKNKLDLFNKSVTSNTVEGFYLLKADEKVYLLNYDQYYFNALPSYSDTKKANRKMQWFVWELPKLGNSAFFFKPNNLALIVHEFNPEIGKDVASLWTFSSNDGNDYNLNFYVDNSRGNKIIESVIQTKMFDFGAMERFKSIEQMYVGFGKVEGETAIQYLTDKGTLDKGVVEINENGDMQSPEFIETKRFLPGIKRALRFGLRLTASGKIAISGILIKYKYMGVTR